MSAMDALVEELDRSFREVQERMSDPAVYNDHREAAEVGRRLKELEGPHKLAQEWQTVRDDLDAARADSDLRELVPGLEEQLQQLEDELKLALVENDPADRKDVIVEVRQGAGGDEAALWARELYRMLTRYAERRGFKVEDLGMSENDSGGVKEATFAIKGDGAFSIFKWEGGTHRVQRVPETESQGRIHTSTGTVAVMPEAEDVDVQIDENDLKIDVYRSTGPGGQSVNTTDSAVRITHLPTGTVVSDAGREVAAAEPPEGDARPAGAAARGRSLRSSARSRTLPGARRSAAVSAPRRSAPTTSRRTGSRTTACT